LEFATDKSAAKEGLIPVKPLRGIKSIMNYKQQKV
jgi:hypothetical protein